MLEDVDAIDINSGPLARGRDGCSHARRALERRGVRRFRT